MASSVQNQQNGLQRDLQKLILAVQNKGSAITSKHTDARNLLKPSHIGHHMIH